MVSAVAVGDHLCVATCQNSKFQLQSFLLPLSGSGLSRKHLSASPSLARWLEGFSPLDASRIYAGSLGLLSRLLAEYAAFLPCVLVYTTRLAASSVSGLAELLGRASAFDKLDSVDNGLAKLLDCNKVLARVLPPDGAVPILTVKVDLSFLSLKHGTALRR